MKTIPYKKQNLYILAYNSTIRRWLKAAAMLVALIFFCQQITWAQGGTPIQSTPIATSPLLRGVSEANDEAISEITIPQDKAITKEISITSSDEIILNIQDAHDSLSAQHSIVDILDTLTKEYNLNLVAIEGSTGYIDTSLLKTFPVEDIRNTVAEDLMKEGELGAGEFFSIVNDKDIELYGIEDNKLYKEHLNLFKQRINEKASSIATIDLLINDLNTIEQSIYPKQVKNLNRISKDYKDNKISFKEYWKNISQIASPYGEASHSSPSRTTQAPRNDGVESVPRNDGSNSFTDGSNSLTGGGGPHDMSFRFLVPRRQVYMRCSGREQNTGISEIAGSNYSNLKKLIDSIEIEKTIDFKAANKERKALIHSLKQTLPKEDLELLLLKSLQYKLKKISSSSFHEYLIGLTDGKYANLTTYTSYVSLYETIDISSLFNEIEHFEENLIQSFFTTEDQKTLHTLTKQALILKDLFNITLTNGRLEYLLNNIDSFNPEAFISYLTKKRSPGLNPGYVSSLEKLFSSLSDAVDFYRLAKERDKAIVNNTLKKMRKNNEKVAALITGGFHTQGMTNILKSKNTSYIVLVPKFDSKSPKRPYVAILTRKNSEYTKLLDTGKYQIATYSRFQTNPDLFTNKDSARSFAEEVIVPRVKSLIKTYRQEDRKEYTKIWIETYRTIQEDLLKQGKIQESIVTPEELEAMVEELLQDRVITVREEKTIKLQRELGISHPAGHSRTSAAEAIPLLLKQIPKEGNPHKKNHLIIDLYFAAKELLDDRDFDVIKEVLPGVMTALFSNKPKFTNLGSAVVQAGDKDLINALCKVIEEMPYSREMLAPVLNIISHDIHKTRRLVSYLIVGLLDKGSPSDPKGFIIPLEHVINNVRKKSDFTLVHQLGLLVLNGYNCETGSNMYDEIRIRTRYLWYGNQPQHWIHLFGHLRGKIHRQDSEGSLYLLWRTLIFLRTNNKEILRTQDAAMFKNEEENDDDNKLAHMGIFPDKVVEDLINGEDAYLSEENILKEQETMRLLFKKIAARRIIGDPGLIPVSILLSLSDKELEEIGNEIYRETGRKIIAEPGLEERSYPLADLIWSFRFYAKRYSKLDDTEGILEIMSSKARFMSRYWHEIFQTACDENGVIKSDKEDNPLYNAIRAENQNSVTILAHLADARERLMEKMFLQENYDPDYEENQQMLMVGQANVEEPEEMRFEFTDRKLTLYVIDGLLRQLEEKYMIETLNELYFEVTEENIESVLQVVYYIVRMLYAKTLIGLGGIDYAEYLNHDRLTYLQLKDILNLINKELDDTRNYFFMALKSSRLVDKLEMREPGLESLSREVIPERILDFVNRKISEGQVYVYSERYKTNDKKEKAYLIGNKLKSGDYNRLKGVGEHLIGDKGKSIVRSAILGEKIAPVFIMPAGMSEEDMVRNAPENMHILEEYLESSNDYGAGKRYGDVNNPLVVSVRSGAIFPLPGQMLTVSNVGITEDMIPVLSREYGAWTAWDSYRRFLEDWAIGIHGMTHAEFDKIINDIKAKYSHDGKPNSIKKRSLPPEVMKEIALAYRIAIENKGHEIPDNPWAQLENVIRAVRRSWGYPNDLQHGMYARAFRKNILNISDNWPGTPVSIGAMIFGNRNVEDEEYVSGSGVLLSRDPITGDLAISGDFEVSTQGTDLADGTVIPKELKALKVENPVLYRKLVDIAMKFEDFFGMAVEIEFTVDRNEIFILQARELRVGMAQIKNFIGEEKFTPIAKGIGASGGAFRGIVINGEQELHAIKETVRKLEPAIKEYNLDGVILVFDDATPDDINKLPEGGALILRRGGRASHAVDVARDIGLTIVAGAKDFSYDSSKKIWTLNNKRYAEGSVLSINGKTGNIYKGRINVNKEQAAKTSAAEDNENEESRRAARRFVRAFSGNDFEEAMKTLRSFIGQVKTAQNQAKTAQDQAETAWDAKAINNKISDKFSMLCSFLTVAVRYRSKKTTVLHVFSDTLGTKDNDQCRFVMHYIAELAELANKPGGEELKDAIVGQSREMDAEKKGARIVEAILYKLWGLAINSEQKYAARIVEEGVRAMTALIESRHREILTILTMPLEREGKSFYDKFFYCLYKEYPSLKNEVNALESAFISDRLLKRIWRIGRKARQVKRITATTIKHFSESFLSKKSPQLPKKKSDPVKIPFFKRIQKKYAGLFIKVILPLILLIVPLVYIARYLKSDEYDLREPLTPEQIAVVVEDAALRKELFDSMDEYSRYDIMTNWEAIIANVITMGDDASDHLLRLAESNDSAIRNIGFELLSKKGEIVLLAQLAKDAPNRSMKIRERALESIGALENPNPRLVEKDLIELLKDPNEDIRRLTKMALDAINEKSPPRPSTSSGPRTSTAEDKAGNVLDEAKLKELIEKTWQNKIKVGSSVNYNTVNSAFNDRGFNASDIAGFIKELRKNRLNIYIVPDGELRGRSFLFSRRTGNDNVYFERKAFDRGHRQGILTILSSIQDAIDTNRHVDRRKKLKAQMRNCWNWGWTEARPPMPKKTAVPAVSRKSNTAKPSSSTVEPVLSKTKKAKNHKAATAASSTLMGLLEHMLDPKAMMTRGLEQWRKIYSDLEKYFCEPGPATAHEREAYDLVIKSGSGATPAEIMKGEKKFDISKIKKASAKQTVIKARPKGHPSARKTTVSVENAGDDNMGESKDKLKAWLILNYARFAAKLIAILGSMELDRGLPPSPAGGWVEMTSDHRKSLEDFQTILRDSRREGGYKNIEALGVIGFRNKAEYESGDVRSPINAETLFLARFSGFAPDVKSFPDIARKLIKSEVKRVEYIGPEGDCPPHLVIYFSNSAAAVFVSKEDWGDVIPRNGEDGVGFLERCSQLIENEGNVKPLAFDEDTPPADKLDRIERLFHLALANKLVARTKYKLLTPEGARLLADFLGRTPEEKEAIYLQALTYVKFVLNAKQKNPKEKQAEEKALKADLLKKFTNWQRILRLLVNIYDSMELSRLGAGDPMLVIERAGIISSGIDQLFNYKAYALLFELIFMRRNNEWIVSDKNLRLLLKSLDSVRDSLLDAAAYADSDIFPNLTSQVKPYFIACLNIELFNALPHLADRFKGVLGPCRDELFDIAAQQGGVDRERLKALLGMGDAEIELSAAVVDIGQLEKEVNERRDLFWLSLNEPQETKVASSMRNIANELGALEARLKGFRSAKDGAQRALPSLELTSESERNKESLRQYFTDLSAYTTQALARELEVVSADPYIERYGAVVNARALFEEGKLMGAEGTKAEEDDAFTSIQKARLLFERNNTAQRAIEEFSIKADTTGIYELQHKGRKLLQDPRAGKIPGIGTKTKDNRHLKALLQDPAKGITTKAMHTVSALQKQYKASDEFAWCREVESFIRDLQASEAGSDAHPLTGSGRHRTSAAENKASQPIVPQGDKDASEKGVSAWRRFVVKPSLAMKDMFTKEPLTKEDFEMQSILKWVAVLIFVDIVSTYFAFFFNDYDKLPKIWQFYFSEETFFNIAKIIFGGSSYGIVYDLARYFIYYLKNTIIDDKGILRADLVSEKDKNTLHRWAEEFRQRIASAEEIIKDEHNSLPTELRSRIAQLIRNPMAECRLLPWNNKAIFNFLEATFNKILGEYYLFGNLGDRQDTLLQNRGEADETLKRLSKFLKAVEENINRVARTSPSEEHSKKAKSLPAATDAEKVSDGIEGEIDLDNPVEIKDRILERLKEYVVLPEGHGELFEEVVSNVIESHLGSHNAGHSIFGEDNSEKELKKLGYDNIMKRLEMQAFYSYKLLLRVIKSNKICGLVNEPFADIVTKLKDTVGDHNEILLVIPMPDNEDYVLPANIGQPSRIIEFNQFVGQWSYAVQEALKGINAVLEEPWQALVNTGEYISDSGEPESIVIIGFEVKRAERIGVIRENLTKRLIGDEVEVLKRAVESLLSDGGEIISQYDLLTRSSPAFEATAPILLIGVTGDVNRGPNTTVIQSLASMYPGMSVETVTIPDNRDEAVSTMQAALSLERIENPNTFGIILGNTHGLTPEDLNEAITNHTLSVLSMDSTRVSNIIKAIKANEDEEAVLDMIRECGFTPDELITLTSVVDALFVSLTPAQNIQYQEGAVTILTSNGLRSNQDLLRTNIDNMIRSKDSNLLLITDPNVTEADKAEYIGRLQRELQGIDLFSIYNEENILTYNEYANTTGTTPQERIEQIAKQRLNTTFTHIVYIEGIDNFNRLVTLITGILNGDRQAIQEALILLGKDSTHIHPRAFKQGLLDLRGLIEEHRSQREAEETVHQAL